ncbi:c-type cytochrome biogenesis protein CcmI [Idiomarina xiamenensis]|uniref:TPR-containing protein n=1 Tax=Idiomarina xiamenensis 10-D-4 TaxID=740709 RepID=K2JZD1_9GAMM|nr:c-type cytochrome biogenesis protein CcmI [Idiomarina xiamenensis]EKE80803.1 TPR-containing protein [Idiomarina xiamenensis 10-D-4]
MIVNGLAMACLVLIGMLFLLVAGRRQAVQRQSRQAFNRQLYQQRFSELQQEHHQGLLGDDEFREAEQELERQYLADTERQELALGSGKTRLLWPALLVMLIAVGSYFLGNSWRLQWQADQALTALPELGKKVMMNSDESATIEEINQFALGLRQKLARQPDDAVAWLIYARLMLTLQQTGEAFQAFEKSLALQPERVGTLVSYSQALLAVGGEQQLQRASSLLARALTVQPQQADALSLAGFVAYQRGDWKQAIEAWQALLAQLPEDAERRQVLANAIADAETRQQQQAQALQVTVTIDEQLRAAIPTDATLFVYVINPNGRPMPAAVIRQPLSELPVSVSLSDADAMLADYQMSQLDQWQVVARISQDQRIDTTVGDLEGRSAVLENQPEQQVSIIIDRRLTE